MKSPLRVALGPDGLLFVSDYAWQRVLTVRQDNLGILDSFSVRGRPTAVGFHDGRIFVGNEATGVMEVHSTDGQLLYEFETPIKRPHDIAISTEQELVFVVDASAKSVEVFTLEGDYVRSIPAPDEEPLASPTAVALRRQSLGEDIDRNGSVSLQDLMAVLGAWRERGGPEDVNRDGIVDVQDLSRVLAKWGAKTPAEEVLVSDYGNPAPDAMIEPAVRIYDLQGVHLQTISGSERFSRPQGMMTNGNGQVFVADNLLCKILVIDLETGEIVRTLGEFGDDTGQLRLPLDVVIEPGSGDVFVTNNQLGRIEVFREEGQQP
ncbi:MAG: hypothetical protein JSV91_00335 [Phycisphaerales bacterium]|nr:MAG: hypothetical protein JSV91_00335 [Phycisphaerales bacterium]